MSLSSAPAIVPVNLASEFNKPLQNPMCWPNIYSLADSLGKKQWQHKKDADALD
ncbi:unnamed protein product [Dovyalis caffra]|uniref:Uncharacterized protein n=1 Tax=Dovyalis caffra TaxID=77055 RepID=A0AAV1SUT5_9ROSI|nr:unnamed protein product [Dovyalis caffra]